MKRSINLYTLMKYAYPVAIVFLSSEILGEYNYLLSGILELLIIFFLTNSLLRICEWLGKIINYIALFVFNVQFTILFFSSSLVSLVMLNNIDSIETISGKASLYFIGLVSIFFSTLIPPKYVSIFTKKNSITILILLILCEGIFVHVNGEQYSPYMSLYNVCKEYSEQQSLREKILNDEISNSSNFLQYGISNSISKPEGLPDQPNVILIFTEGLSQNIILDERNIMPNVKAVQEQSISFKNYYNHTFATYMGLSGQLYSGYQMQNYDKNMLVSLQEILHEQGYQTSFINVEPFNEEFTTYLADMNFDNLINNKDLAKDNVNTISDKDAYEFLFNFCKKQSANGPFFTVIYTLGTHTQWINEGEKFGDGSNSYLNKFYNADWQFGKFIEKFNKSILSENTIIVFTADHATYRDTDFVNSFPSYKREADNIDKIPLFIYHKGIEPKVIDANGKNSLDLAPTILDYLDISEINYFLGTSLFAVNEKNEYDTIFQSFSEIYLTKNAVITPIDDLQREIFQEKISDYFAVKIRGENELEQTPYIETKFLNGGLNVEVVLYNADEYEEIWFTTWSVENGQDDIKWIQGTKSSDGTWKCVINREKMETYAVHVYEGSNEPETKLLEYIIV